MPDVAIAPPSCELECTENNIIHRQILFGVLDDRSLAAVTNSSIKLIHQWLLFGTPELQAFIGK